jgi:diguanylate cyclase (GGDEF)-like protein
LNAVAVLLVMLAIVLLGGALILAVRLFAEIPAGPTLLRWRVNAALLGLTLLLAVASLFPLRESPATPWMPLAHVLAALLACLVLLLFHGATSLVNKMRQVSSLDRAVVTDALTGLRQRAYLDKRMKEEMSRSQRHGQAVSLILLDVDDFASVNRAHGHDVGDQVLMDIGEILGAGLRQSDVLVRYAGEEMAVLATDTAPAGALLVAERLRRDVEVGARKSLREAQGARRNITVSAGVAGVDAGVKGRFDLFSAAERALDQAKKEGKNRVVLGPPGPADFSLTIPPPPASRH